MGYETPGWFAGPDKGGGAATRSGAGRPAASGAEGRSGVGVRSSVTVADLPYKSGSVRGVGAERSSALSDRSIAPRYGLIVPVYNRPESSPYGEATSLILADIRRLRSFR